VRRVAAVKTSKAPSDRCSTAACALRGTGSSHNTYDDIYGAVVMAQSHCESLPGSLDECRL